MKRQQYDILIVEDDPQDVDLIEQALKAAELMINIHSVADGRRALAYLRRQGSYAQTPRPDTVLLDLNLPGLSGREILQQIKADPAMKDIPVLVLTTSDAESDILASYRAGANCYLTKPPSFSGYVDLVKKIEQFWFDVVKLPPRLA